jgi:hypothetical protein
MAGRWWQPTDLEERRRRKEEKKGGEERRRRKEEKKGGEEKRRGYHTSANAKRHLVLQGCLAAWLASPPRPLWHLARQ